jgi:hypothetical protein
MGLQATHERAVALYRDSALKLPQAWVGQLLFPPDPQSDALRPTEKQIDAAVEQARGDDVDRILQPAPHRLEAACGVALVPRCPVVTPLSISSRPGCLAIGSPNQIQVTRNKT